SAGEHPAETLDQALGWADSTVLDPVEHRSSIAVADVLLDELTQFSPFRLPLQKERREGHIVFIEAIRQHTVVGVVVQVGTGLKGDVVLVDRFIKILEKRRIRPGLVGRVAYLAFTVREPGSHDGIPVRFAGTLPLLKLNDDQLFGALAVLARENEVDPLRRLRNSVLNGNAAISGNVFVVENLRQGHEGFFPGKHLRDCHASAGAGSEGLKNDVFDILGEGIFQKPRLVILIDDHYGPQRSVYFLLLPRALWTGYFLALTAILSKAAAVRSMSSLSARRMRYRRTSASSSRTLVRVSSGSAADSRSGSHWK